MSVLIPILSRFKVPRPIFTQTRCMRPTVKINKEKFQITMHIRKFEKEEIQVKAREEYLIIEGRQERKTQEGYVTRHFLKKFKLPKGCDVCKIQSTLSEDGTLTVTAPRDVCDINLPCETTVPIKFIPSKEEGHDDTLLKTIQSKKNPDDY